MGDDWGHVGAEHLREKLDEAREKIKDLYEENAELKRQLMRRGQLDYDENDDLVDIDKIFSGDA